jgi:cell fate regulator YaaT (PSP1 superfamily)
MAKVIGVKFKSAGKVYYFAPLEEEYKEEMGVIVETARGVEFGKVVLEKKEIPDSEIIQPLKPVLRIATKKDYEQLEKNLQKRPDALKTAEEKIEKHKLSMKLIDCEFTFDGNKVIFYFTAEGRIDFRELVKDLASAFRIRIELRQVGIRDEAKLLGGIAPCGRVCCCASCMPDFKKVSIKMAKTQGLSLNPSKISGLCGRLMCCLEYENDHYSKTYKIMPKQGNEVSTPDGKGIVISNNMLKLLVKVKVENSDGSLVYKEFPLDKIKVIKANKDDDSDDNVNDEIKEILD